MKRILVLVFLSCVGCSSLLSLFADTKHPTPLWARKAAVAIDTCGPQEMSLVESLISAISGGGSSWIQDVIAGARCIPAAIQKVEQTIASNRPLIASGGQTIVITDEMVNRFAFALALHTMMFPH